MQLQLHYTNYTTPQLQLHYTTTTTAAALHHTTSSSCGRGDRPGDHCNHCSRSKKTQVQPPFSPSVDSLCHPWFTTTKLSYRFPVLKLPPLPCAVLLVDSISAAVCISGLTWFPFRKKTKLLRPPRPFANIQVDLNAKAKRAKTAAACQSPYWLLATSGDALGKERRLSSYVYRFAHMVQGSLMLEKRLETWWNMYVYTNTVTGQKKNMARHHYLWHQQKLGEDKQRNSGAKQSRQDEKLKCQE